MGSLTKIPLGPNRVLHESAPVSPSRQVYHPIEALENGSHDCKLTYHIATMTKPKMDSVCRSIKKHRGQIEMTQWCLRGIEPEAYFLRSSLMGMRAKERRYRVLKILAERT